MPQERHIGDVVVVNAAGEGYGQPPLGGKAQLIGHVQSDREQGLAGHVHGLALELAPDYLHRESVGELYAEDKALALRQSHQAVYHCHGVGQLHVVVKVSGVKAHIAVAHLVQHGPYTLVTQQGGVAFDVCVEAFFLNEIGGYALYLVGRTAVHGGQGHQLTDMGVKAPDKGLVYIFEQGQAANRRIQALLPEGTLPASCMVLRKSSMTPLCMPARL